MLPSMRGVRFNMQGCFLGEGKVVARCLLKYLAHSVLLLEPLTELAQDLLLSGRSAQRQ
jgi:hypothetical protein